MQEPGDPAVPRFAAEEPRVVDTPFGRLDEAHPLRRAIAEITFPASGERVLAAVRSDPRVGAEQAGWLASSIRADQRFETPDDLVAALGAWGPPPPGAPSTL